MPSAVQYFAFLSCGDLVSSIARAPAASPSCSRSSATSIRIVTLQHDHKTWYWRVGLAAQNLKCCLPHRKAANGGLADHVILGVRITALPAEAPLAIASNSALVIGLQQLD